MSSAAKIAGTAASPTTRAEIAPIAYQNKAVVYDLLFRRAAETLFMIAADPKHLGAHRRPRRAPQLGLGRRDLPRRLALGALQARLSVTGAGAVRSVPAALPDCARRRPRRGAGWRSLARSPVSVVARPSPGISHPSGARTGSSTPSRPSPAPKRCWPFSPATPI